MKAKQSQPSTSKQNASVTPSPPIEAVPQVTGHQHIQSPKSPVIRGHSSPNRGLRQSFH